MEATLNFIFAYPLSSLFLVFVTISSFTHLWLNKGVFHKGFFRLMFFVAVPAMVTCMVLVVDYFYKGINFYVIPLTLILSLTMGLLKSIVPRSKYKDGVIEVFGKWTPKYPSDYDTYWNRYEWHQKMDMLALTGLAFFIFLDHKILPWIWEGFSLAR